MQRVSYRGGALTGHQACAEMQAMKTQTKRHEAMHDQRGYVGRLTCNASIKTCNQIYKDDFYVVAALFMCCHMDKLSCPALVLLCSAIG